MQRYTEVLPDVTALDFRRPALFPGEKAFFWRKRKF